LLLRALAECGGVRRAAQRLGIPRSTFSRRLERLEADVGARLALRTTRRVALTELGAELAERAARLASLLEETEELVRRATAEPRGVLRISAAPVLGEQVLPEIVPELARRYSRVTIDVRMSVEYVDVRRDTDVALRAALPENAADLFAARLGTSTTGFFASPKYLARAGVPTDPGELSSHECILVSGRTRWRVGARGAATVAVKGRVGVDSFSLARALAVQGAGIATIAVGYVRTLVDAGELVPILERHWPRTPLFAIHARGAPAPAPIRAFIELAREAVGRRYPRR
jgi:DNA-binding transcriptional LysR family regulator